MVFMSFVGTMKANGKIRTLFKIFKVTRYTRLDWLGLYSLEEESRPCPTTNQFDL
jgi:hypothetical protein